VCGGWGGGGPFKKIPGRRLSCAGEFRPFANSLQLQGKEKDCVLNLEKK
jgi:hypothetical protein